MKKSMFSFIIMLSFILIQGQNLTATDQRYDKTNHNNDEIWTPGYMVENFKRVGGTEISPDGKWIAFTVSEAMIEGEESRYLTHIYLVKSDGSRKLQLTRGNESASNPQWSPDGKYLSFISARGNDGNQIWMINPEAGESWQVTQAEGSIRNYKWSNNGGHIAFTMIDPPSEEQQYRLKNRKDANVEGKDLNYSHVYVFKADPQNHEPANIQRLTKGDFHVGSFDWSPDDKTIVFDHQPRPEHEYWPETSISKVPADSGKVEKLIDLGGSDSSPVYSPCGKYLAFTTDNGNPRWPVYEFLKIKNLENGSLTRLGKTHDDEPRNIKWSPDGDKIFYMELNKTSIDLFAMPVEGKDAQYRQITKGPGQFTGFSLSADASKLAAIHQNFDQAPDIIVSDLKSFNPVRLTNINEGYEQTEIAEAKVIKYESTDGKLIEATLIYPLDYEKGEKYPVLLHVHGGPTGVFRETYVASPGIYPLQKFAAEGYFVLRPNFRGSGGYGKDFRFANISDWGFGDLEDMKAGLDKLIEQGKVDPDQQAIMGWSYGGYMSSFAITQTHRFQTSMVGAGVTNLISMTGTSDIPSFLPDYFESEYWDNYELYQKHSAIFNVENINTPTLILHPEEDIRVPPSQGYELYVALKRLGVETKMVTYPRQPHGIREPKLIIDAAERQIKWLKKYLNNKE